MARFVVYVHSLCGHAWGMVRTGTAAAGVLRLRGAAAPGRTAQRKNFQRTSTRLFAAVFFVLRAGCHEGIELPLACIPPSTGQGIEVAAASLATGWAWRTESKKAKSH